MWDTLDSENMAYLQNELTCIFVTHSKTCYFGAQKNVMKMFLTLTHPKHMFDKKTMIRIIFGGYTFFMATSLHVYFINFYTSKYKLYSL